MLYIFSWDWKIMRLNQLYKLILDFSFCPFCVSFHNNGHYCALFFLSQIQLIEFINPVEQSKVFLRSNSRRDENTQLNINYVLSLMNHTFDLRFWLLVVCSRKRLRTTPNIQVLSSFITVRFSDFNGSDLVYLVLTDINLRFYFRSIQISTSHIWNVLCHRHFRRHYY